MKSPQIHGAILLGFGCLIAYLLFGHAQDWLVRQGLNAWLVKLALLLSAGLAVAALDLATNKNGGVQQWLRWKF